MTSCEGRPANQDPVVISPYGEVRAELRVFYSPSTLLPWGNHDDERDKHPKTSGPSQKQ